MEPLMHLVLPLLFLLALRVDTRRAFLFAPLAILPDFDALFGLHRALGHSIVPIVVLPLIILMYAKYRRPEWMLSALLVQFYLASHIVLDLGGVAFLWPFYQQQFYFEPMITFAASDGFDIGFSLEYGVRDLREMGTTSVLSDAGLALVLLAALAAVIFREDAARGARKAIDAFRDLLRWLLRRA